MELVLGSVDDPGDWPALRLACKRGRASVDGRVVAVRGGRSMTKSVGKQELEALVRPPWQLQRLDLSGRQLGSRAAAIKRLLEEEDDLNSLGDAGAASLAAAPWHALRELNLHDSGLSDSDVAALAAARWPDLHKLNLCYNSLSPAGVASLAAAPWHALRELDLGNNYVGDEGAASLAAAPWHALQVLNLEMSSFGEEGVEALAAAHFTAIRELNLGHND